MTQQDLPPEFLARLAEIKGKRAKIVVNHILAHGFITTEELKETYGYTHPPRAVRDVRERGIPIEQFQVKDSLGRKIAAYRFGDPSEVRNDRFQGRTAFSKQFKQDLIKLYGCKCQVCLAEYEERYLQIDHRVPYEVAGNPDKSERDTQEYMLVCASCNRAKSWSCEHCTNWLQDKSVSICNTCYWVQPESYEHIVLRPIRRLELVWEEQEVEIYEQLKQQAQALDEPIPAYIKAVLEKHLRDI